MTLRRARRTARRSGLVRALACVVAMASASAGALLAAGPGAAGAAGAATAPRYVAAAEYFGGTNPYTLWSSTLSGAPAAFRQMRAAGFNAVALVVPWGEFEPGLSPVRYDKGAFTRLGALITDARRLGMGVILRLSYEWDVDPFEQKAFGARFQTLWSGTKVYNAWLGFIATVHAKVARYPNVRAAYISWEDLWQPVFDAQATTTAAQRLALAKRIGYRAWLKGNVPMATVEHDYGATFPGWTAVPTPAPDQPAFALMYRYQDWALVHRLFVPAAKRYPGLTMETRVDVDPIYTGKAVVGSFPHSTQYQLPGTTTTGMYFSPYMGDPSATKTESAADGVVALHSTLSRMASSSGGRHLFIYEYEFVSNSPAVAEDPAIPPDQVATFIAQSAPVLAQDTVGYALWVFRDYLVSPVYNPSFALGASGWKLAGGARAVARPGGRSYVSLRAGASATTRRLQPVLVTSSAPATASIEADATTPTTVTVQWGTSTQSVQVGAGWQTYHLTVPPGGAGSSGSAGSLRVSASGAVQVSDVQIGWFTQQGDVYGVTGQPGPALGALSALNAQLTGAG